jgi:2-polyprenyl-6-hydroxyphenyl methylase/3-demethylubiquinone-9 3-methyltransferase
LVIFANCFYPVIECHLPLTFYLRHTFRRVLEGGRLEFLGTIPGAEHVQVFRKGSAVDEDGIRRRDQAARRLGPWLNRYHEWVNEVRSVARVVVGRR